MAEGKPFSLIKPTINTPFHIDFNWWKEHDHNWQIHLRGCLCAEHQEIFNEVIMETNLDWIDPVTAEVKPIDGLQHTLITHCARQPDFITRTTTLVDSVFRILLANGNTPLTPNELANEIQRTPDTILRTLTGQNIYSGIRPLLS